MYATEANYFWDGGAACNNLSMARNLILLVAILAAGMFAALRCCLCKRRHTDTPIRFPQNPRANFERNDITITCETVHKCGLPIRRAEK